MKAYKFLRDDMRSGYGDEPAWKVGETRRLKGEVELCKRGYHSCPTWYDALSYACGNMACVVDVSCPAAKDTDKQASRRCMILSCLNAEKVLRAWACDCAERALTAAKVADERSWNTIKVARLFNDGKATKEELAAASAAARAAAWAAAWAAASDAARAAAWAAASDAAWAAASDAARAAARAAAWAAASAAASDAAWAAASDAASDAARAAAWAAEIKWQKQHLDKLMQAELKGA